jgi:uncharacterized membrane protein (TIGR02234 family)
MDAALYDGRFRLSPRRLKNLSMLAGIVLSGLVLLSWTCEWFSLTIGGKAAAHSTLSVTGNTAAPALIALALAGLALIGALAISGPVIRAILGVVQSLIGFTVVFSAVGALVDPVGASEPLITSTTGVAGNTSVAKLVTADSISIWPWFALVVGVLVFALGIFIVATGRRWPGSSKKYQPVRLEQAEVGENPVADWDSLSGGGDPTAR